MVGNAGFSPHHILGGCDAKCLNNGLSGERPQPPDVISALAAVELRQVDDAAVQKSGHCLRFRIGKHAHCLDPGERSALSRWACRVWKWETFYIEIIRSIFDGAWDNDAAGARA